jgi:predicted metal-dependent phosphoesterase TrpH
MQLQTWSSADLHIHTSASDGVATPEMVLEWVCRETDLSVIAITDHNTNSGGLEAVRLAADGRYPVEVIVGQEVESSDGHIIGLWTPEPVRPGMPASETVAAIHAQGGLAIVAHPFAPRLWARAGLDRGDRLLYDSVAYDGIEIANSTPLLFLANWFARFYWTTHHRRLACTGGSDAHILRAIGSSRTWFRGETAADLRAAIESRSTRAELPGVSLLRNWRYAWNVPRIMARDRDRKAREVEEGIRPEHRRRRAGD